ncbi:MAG: cytidine deaminase, partial [Bacilli bacterium]|nr:cytidine deaminase [Bacilli bacterium]MDD4608292.1 cytidine deaminase [Bacilli bacterium]
CAKLIIQSGIKEVIYLSDKYAKTDNVIASKALFDMCGVTYKQLDKDKMQSITISLEEQKKR